MKVITIKQPWASLIVHDIKDIENRTWPCPKKYIGQKVLIHASSTSWTWHRVLNYITKPMLSVFVKLGYNGSWLRDLPTGGIIGSVRIVDCVVNHPSIWADKTKSFGCDINPMIHEKITGEKVVYNWVLDNPILFPEPIPYKGKLSFWDYPGIPKPEFDEDGHRICMCTMNVKEENQVISMIDHFECRYCGGRWYK